MYENDTRTGTDYEYNHALDELLQMRTKINTGLEDFVGKGIDCDNKISRIEALFVDDGSCVKVQIKDLGLIEMTLEQFHDSVRD